MVIFMNHCWNRNIFYNFYFKPVLVLCSFIPGGYDSYKFSLCNSSTAYNILFDAGRQLAWIVVCGVRKIFK